MIHPERIRFLNKKKIQRGRYLFYWMQAAQREEYNHALEYAIDQANRLGQPLVVFFGLTDRFPEANARHYTFMLQGLRETKAALKKRGLQLVVQHISPERGAVKLSREASMVFVDRGYLRIQRQWRAWAAQRLRCPLVQVESEVVVPVEAASSKEEYSAATLRPKIHKRLNEFLRPLRRRAPEISSVDLNFDSIDIADIDEVLSRLKIDDSVSGSRYYLGGTTRARRLFRQFTCEHLDHFADRRNDPSVDRLSGLSPYLHFGQISPLFVARQVLKTASPGKEAFLEELIVRRELSMNFVFYNRGYDRYRGLPDWARKTLEVHRLDPRPTVYSRRQLERAKTHDPYWNAAQREMMLTGKMHGYMRMYWGKKILEWSRQPQKAFQTALYLNNKYELDGRDPNGFAGVAWCFGKHDRPWGERPIFGTIRYMNDRGLRRKFDIERYVQRVEEMLAAAKW
jgi:deoxyribodipyrimidine photo-lyase